MLSCNVSEKGYTQYTYLCASLVSRPWYASGEGSDGGKSTVGARVHKSRNRVVVKMSAMGYTQAVVRSPS
jgi:hypothetical protein